jgi:hypothetical protein
VEEDRIQIPGVIRKGLPGFLPNRRKREQSTDIWLDEKVDEGSVDAMKSQDHHPGIYTAQEL